MARLKRVQPQRNLLALGKPDDTNKLEEVNMKSLIERTGPGRFFRQFLSPSTRVQTPALTECRQRPELIERRKILIVDDDAVILKALTLKLETAGYAVVTASDGADALRALREEKPDLVLLDISFPPDVPHGGGVPWDGFLLMRWLRGIEKVGKVPIVFMTANDPGSYRDRALACGAAGLFHKPLEPRVLVSVVERILNGTGSAEPFGLSANYQI
jgi:CheY-like chemotaxis protein